MRLSIALAATALVTLGAAAGQDQDCRCQSGVETISVPGGAVAETGAARPASPERRFRGPAGLIERFDTNGDGVITIESELPEERGQRLVGADANTDGTLTSEELRAYFESRRGQLGPGQERGERPPMTPERMIERFDTNGDGLIQLETEVTNEARRARLAQSDANGDGALDLEEVRTFLETSRQRALGVAGGRPGPGAPPARP